MVGTPGVFLFIHGGVWIVGNFENHTRLLRDLVVGSGQVGVFVEYTPLPLARFPVQMNECYAALQWVADYAELLDHLDVRDAMLVGHSTGGGEVAHYIGKYGTKRVAKAVLVSAVPPLMLRTPTNPNGTPIEVFDDIRKGVAENRAQFYKYLSLPFFGYNRRGATTSEGIRENFWLHGMLGGVKGQYDCIHEFSEIDYTEDLVKMSVPTLIVQGDDDQIVPIEASGKRSAEIAPVATLKIYPGAPHGLPITHQDQLNADQLGAIVTAAVPGSPVAQADIRPGDIIAGADGREMDSASAVLRYVATRPVTQPISLLVWRDRAMQEVVLRGKSWPHMSVLRSNVLASAANVAQAQAAGLGLHLAARTTVADAGGGSASGVLVQAVTPQSQADTLGLRPGDVIERVDGKAATTPAQVMRQLTHGSAADGNVAALLVHGRRNTRWVTLYVGRVQVGHLIATPALPGGFGPVGNDVSSLP